MKYGILFFVIVGAVAASQALTKVESETLLVFVNECTAETGIDSSLVPRLRKGEDVNDEGARNFIFCMYKKLGFVTEDGVFQLDNIRAVLSVALSEEEINHLIKECAEHKATPQETAHDSYICYRKLNHDYLISQ